MIDDTFRSHKVYRSAEVVSRWHGVIETDSPDIPMGAPVRITLYRGYASHGYRTNYKRQPESWVEAAVRLRNGRIRCTVRRLSSRDQDALRIDYFRGEIAAMKRYAQETVSAA